MKCLLDTDITSEILKGRNQAVLRRASAYVQQHGHYMISLMTRYEVLRGLRAKSATIRLRTFETWCLRHRVLPVDESVVVRAADIWATLTRAGRPIGDNDILIAATALHHGLAVATRNFAHFGRVPALTVEDWSQP